MLNVTASVPGADLGYARNGSGLQQAENRHDGRLQLAPEPYLPEPEFVAAEHLAEEDLDVGTVLNLPLHNSLALGLTAEERAIDFVNRSGGQFMVAQGRYLRRA